MLRVKTFRDEAKGLSDLLQAAGLPYPSVVLGKDGSLTTFFWYLGKDVDSSTPEELNLLSARINAALVRLGSGWMIKTDVIRRSIENYPFPEKGFPDAVSQSIDDERRSMFMQEGVQYESINVLSITYLPPLAIESRFFTFLIEDPNRGKAQDIASSHVTYFEQVIGRVALDLSSVVHLQRFEAQAFIDESGKSASYDQMLQFMNYAITGKNHPIRLPSCPMYIDVLLGNEDFIGGLKPRIGKKHISVVTIEGFPSDGEPAILRRLSLLDCEYRWNTRFIFMDRQEARSELEGYRKKWRQKITGFKDQILRTNNGPLDEDAMAKVSEVNSAIGISESGEVGFGYYTSVIVLLNENQKILMEETKEVTKAITDSGFSCREETINAVEAWLGSLPCHSLENVRRPVMHTLNLADLLPMTSVWSGSRVNPSPLFPKNSPALFQGFTSGNTPFFGNIHVGGVGHFIVIGPTGMGKSLLLAFLDAQFLRYPNAKVFAFDQKYSQYALCQAVGGRHFDITGEGGSLSFCPLGNIHKSEAERTWAKEWIANACEHQGFKILSHHKNIISEAIDRLSKAEKKSLTDFSVTVQSQEIRDVIRHYTLDGSLRFMDGESDDFNLSQFNVVEIEELMNLGPKNSIPVLEYLFHRVDGAQDGSPSIMPLDEAWQALSHPIFKEKVREWLKKKRSSNVAVGLATQSISDLVKGDFMDVIESSCPTKIFCADPMARNESSIEYYRSLGLNKKEIEIVSSLIPQRQYFIKTPYGSRVIELGVGKLGLRWLGASSKESVKSIKKLMIEHPVEWRTIWESM